MTILILTGREKDGRHYAHIPTMPGVMVYGDTQDDATVKVLKLASQVVADCFSHGEPLQQEASS